MLAKRKVGGLYRQPLEMSIANTYVRTHHRMAVTRGAGRNKVTSLIACHLFWDRKGEGRVGAANCTVQATAPGPYLLLSKSSCVAQSPRSRLVAGGSRGKSAGRIFMLLPSLRTLHNPSPSCSAAGHRSSWQC